jgi:hypothetical protein
MCVLIFSTKLSETFLTLRRIQRDIITTAHRLPCKISVILVRYYWNLNFVENIFKKSARIEFNENPSSGSQAVTCGRTDGRTDMTKETAAFRSFVNAPKNYEKQPAE